VKLALQDTSSDWLALLVHRRWCAPATQTAPPDASPQARARLHGEASFLDGAKCQIVQIFDWFGVVAG
jgi:hypothetical protein